MSEIKGRNILWVFWCLCLGMLVSFYSNYWPIMVKFDITVQ